MRTTIMLNLILLLMANEALAASSLDYRSQPFVLPADSENLIVADTNGDGLRELITLIDRSIRIYFQDERGIDFDSGYQHIQLPGSAVGWDISTNYGQHGHASIIALIDGHEVLAWHIEGDTINLPESIITGLPGFLSSGVNRLHFSRDINGCLFYTSDAADE